MLPLGYLMKPPPATARREDHGVFGPGSPTWAVWSRPAVLIGGWRAAIVQMFHPPTAAGVAQHSVYQSDFSGRLRRTDAYFATVAMGDSRSAIVASERLRRIHERVGVGTRPLTRMTMAALSRAVLERLLAVLARRPTRSPTRRSTDARRFATRWFRRPRRAGDWWAVG